MRAKRPDLRVMILLVGDCGEVLEGGGFSARMWWRMGRR